MRLTITRSAVLVSLSALFLLSSLEAGGITFLGDTELGQRSTSEDFDGEDRESVKVDFRTNYRRKRYDKRSLLDYNRIAFQSKLTYPKTGSYSVSALAGWQKSGSFPESITCSCRECLFLDASKDH